MKQNNEKNTTKKIGFGKQYEKIATKFTVLHVDPRFNHCIRCMQCWFGCVPATRVCSMLCNTLQPFYPWMFVTRSTVSSSAR